MNNSHYIIKFDDVYLDVQNPGGQTIHGRLMLLALVPMDQGQPYEYTDQLVGGRNEYAYVFDDVIVQDIISKIEVYGGQSNNEFKFIDDVIGLYSDEYWDAHVGMTDITHAWRPLNVSNNIYISLDPNYSTPSGNKSNKVLRTLATGQSDITRHEAYTKVTGLNESNGLVPTYINKEQTLNQMLQIVKKSVPEATQIVLYYPNSLYRASDIYNIGEARLAVAFPNNYIYQIVSNIVSPEGASIANFDTIPVTHSVNSESQYKKVREDFEYVIPTKYTENSGVISSTGSAYNSYAVVSEEDLIALLSLLNNLSNTSMDLYFGVGGK